MPKVSVIIPTYNAANYITEAIDSVLSQTFIDYEVIVVDDGSTDNTRDIIRKYNGKIKYTYQKNSGTSAARNTAIRESRGEYLAFLDADDLWLPEKLEVQVKFLDQNPDLAFVCSDSYVIDKSQKIINIWAKGIRNYETFESLYEENFVLILTVLMRKSCLLNVGGFDEELIISQDYDLWLRIAKKYKFKHLNIPLAKYRLHQNNISRNIALKQLEREKIANKDAISRDLGFVIRMVKRARNYHHFGIEYSKVNNSYKAGACYVKAVLNFPFVGYYYWPKEAENFKFSLPYRILKPYLMIFDCLIFKQIKALFSIIYLSLFKSLTLLVMLYWAFKYQINKLFTKTKKLKLGLLNIEFFHKEIGIFGGYGHVYKNITDYFNTSDYSFQADILLTRPMSFRKPKIKHLDNADVIFHSDTISPGILNTLKYARLINSRKFDLLITMEYYSSYLYSILLLPKTPLIIWIHDPRPKDEWEKISTVPLAKLTDAKNITTDSLNYENESLKRIIGLSKIFNRKVIFATTAYSLIDLAKLTYNLPNIQPILLPTPTIIPDIKGITYSTKPSVCFLGRLDPVKRPWIFFELAKRLTEIDFIVAGKTHFPEVMNPIIEKYANISNLKFLGLVTGEEKEELLKNIWCIINTSIHEALPNSFLESLSYGKPIIACHNPDNLVSRFGVYTGEILGDGLDNAALQKFSDGIEKILSQRDKWQESGDIARNHMAELYSFQKFECILEELYKKIR